MVDNKQFLNMDDIRIDSGFYNSYFSKISIRKYKICTIPVSSIRMRQPNGSYLKITEAPLYKSLKAGQLLDKANEKAYLYTLKLFDTIENEGGYDKRNIIIVNEFNMLIDGQHRLYYLMCKEKSENVMVLKLYVKHNNIIKKILQYIKSFIMSSLRKIIR